MAGAVFLVQAAAEHRASAAPSSAAEVGLSRRGEEGSPQRCSSGSSPPLTVPEGELGNSSKSSWKLS